MELGIVKFRGPQIPKRESYSTYEVLVELRGKEMALPCD
jgi:hypothetical protein